MITTILVIATLVYLIGLRADRIHASRTVKKPEASHTTRVDFKASGSSTTYRGRTARYWAYKYKVRTRQLQAAHHRIREIAKQAPWGNSSLERAFLCIHTYEGSWWDSGAPFWGGLQMDGTFQAKYGAWALKAFGTADHWPISVQLAVAIRAKVSGRGFYPWPNTARACGLL